ncbi:MAG: PAS domain-containing sensor histidine kinase [Candidatus Schekmanbacteria bacterium]|nr:PAS domain-containing sensor histidine kinase [Candidatus Schekmanbacteria bacterium]
MLDGEEVQQLKKFLQDNLEEILANWLERVNQLMMHDPVSKEGDNNPYQNVISACYPEIVRYILGGGDKEIMNWIKSLTQRGYPSGFPLKNVLRGHSILREIINKQIWAEQEKNGWNWQQVKDFTNTVNQIIDQQLQKLSVFYLEIYHDELLSVEKKHAQLTERMPEVIYSYSPQKGLLFISQASQRLLGITPQEFYRQGFQLWIERVHPNDRKNFLACFQQQLQSQSEQEYEYRIVHKNNKDILHVINRSIPILDQAGEVISIDGIVIDITERTKMEQEIRHHNTQLEKLMQDLKASNQQLLDIGQRKSELVNIVAHDLRNPLNSIRIFTELLLTYKNSPDEYEEFLHRIEDETNRLVNLIDNFLDIEKIEAGLMHYREEKIDLAEIVEHFVSIFKWEIDKKQIEIEVKNLANIDPVVGDKSRLYQVFSNLIGNAVKFTPRGGKIILEAKLVGGTRKADRSDHNISDDEAAKTFVKISLFNTGPGIPKKHHKKIFAKFFQLEQPGLKHEKGSGLGLAIAKEVIEHHSGRIWVESEAGNGVTFFFTLPYLHKPC